MSEPNDTLLRGDYRPIHGRCSGLYRGEHAPMIRILAQLREVERSVVPSVRPDRSSHSPKPVHFDLAKNSSTSYVLEGKDVLFEVTLLQRVIQLTRSGVPPG